MCFTREKNVAAFLRPISLSCVLVIDYIYFCFVLFLQTEPSQSVLVLSEYATHSLSAVQPLLRFTADRIMRELIRLRCLQQQQRQPLILEKLSTLSPPTSARNRPQKQTSAARCSAQKVHRTAVSSSELSAALRDTSHSFMGLKSRKLEVRALKTSPPKVFIMQPAQFFFPSATPS